MAHTRVVNRYRTRALTIDARLPEAVLVLRQIGDAVQPAADVRDAPPGHWHALEDVLVRWRATRAAATAVDASS